MADKVAPYGLKGVITGQGAVAPDPDFVPDPGYEDFVPDAPPRAKIGTGKAAALGAVQGASLGASGFIQAALETAAQKVLPDFALRGLQAVNVGGATDLTQPMTFAERRNAYSQRNAQAREDHPVAFTTGEIAGSLAAPAPGASALAARAGSTLGKAAARGFVQGGEYAIGSGLSEGKGAGQIAAEAGTGAALGTLVAPVAHGVGTLAGHALDSIKGRLAERYVRNFGSEVLGQTTKKAPVKAWASILSKEAEPGVEIDAAKKFIQSPEMAPVEKAARKHKWDVAIDKIDERLATLKPQRTANYAAVEGARPFKAGEGLAAIEAAQFKAENALKDSQATKALNKAREEWIKNFSSADSGALQRTLLRPEGLEVSTAVADELRAVVDALPQAGRITRSQIADAVAETKAGPDAIRYISNRILDPEKGILSWHADSVVPAVELRSVASNAQKSALQAFDALNPNASEHAKSVVKKAIVGALEKHLDEAAAVSPAAAKAVARIRNDDVKFSVLLTAKDGLRMAEEKANTNLVKTGHALGKLAHVAAPVLAAHAPEQAKKAAHSLEEGDILGTIGHGAAAVGAAAMGARTLARYGSIGANRLTNALTKLRAAAPQNPRAAELLRAVVARAPAAPVGTVQSSTLGREAGR